MSDITPMSSSVLFLLCGEVETAELQSFVKEKESVTYIQSLGVVTVSAVEKNVPFI